MNILIVDDESTARRGLRETLAEMGLKQVREASSVDQALKAILAERPDVLLLDIEMRGGTQGFDLLEKLPAQGIPVVFITAYEEHAIRAFRVRATDYLLKPVDPKQLMETLSRISGNALNEEPRLGAEEKVLFRENSVSHYIRIGNIQILESVGAYTKLILANERITINGTLGKVLRKFETSLFFRANRSTAVNLREVSRVSETAEGYIVLTVGNHPPVECSRRQSVEFRRMREI
jgi:two-component system, LytTR family, response regulator